MGASWPAARQQINTELRRWEQTGLDSRIDWLLRGVNAVVTGEALFSALDGAKTADLQRWLTDVAQHLDRCLNVVFKRACPHEPPEREDIGWKARLPLSAAANDPQAMDQQVGEVSQGQEKQILKCAANLMYPPVMGMILRPLHPCRPHRWRPNA